MAAFEGVFGPRGIVLIHNFKDMSLTSLVYVTDAYRHTLAVFNVQVKYLQHPEWPEHTSANL